MAYVICCNITQRRSNIFTSNTIDKSRVYRYPRRFDCSVEHQLVRDSPCVIVLEISHHLAGVPMSSGWSRERVGSWQRRHSSTENGQRVYHGQQLLVYGRHAYATGQRPQPQGKRVTAESATVTRTNKTFETHTVAAGSSLDPPRICPSFSIL